MDEIFKQFVSKLPVHDGVKEAVAEKIERLMDESKNDASSQEQKDRALIALDKFLKDVVESTPKEDQQFVEGKMVGYRLLNLMGLRRIEDADAGLTGPSPAAAPSSSTGPSSAAAPSSSTGPSPAAATSSSCSPLDERPFGNLIIQFPPRLDHTRRAERLDEFRMNLHGMADHELKKMLEDADVADSEYIRAILNERKEPTD